MEREAEFCASHGSVAEFSEEKGQPHRIETLAGAGASRLFDGFETASERLPELSMRRELRIAVALAVLALGVAPANAQQLAPRITLIELTPHLAVNDAAALIEAEKYADAIVILDGFIAIQSGASARGVLSARPRALQARRLRESAGSRRARRQHSRPTRP